jgi:hypothetical protein
MNSKAKRFHVLLIGTILAFSLTGCKFAIPDNTEDVTANDASTADTSVLPETVATDETDTTAPGEPGLLDYFPLTPDVFCDYAGTGNEFAARTTHVEYVWPDMIQIVSENAGGQSHMLYAVRDGKVEAIQIAFDLFAREDLSLLIPVSYGEILLQEPLVVGTSWDVTSGTSTITNLHTAVTTPLGTYDALEVTTESLGSTSTKYFVAGIGLVKLVVDGDSYDVTQELQARTVGTARTEMRTFYYPRTTDTDVEIVYQTIPIQMFTNDSFADVLTEQFRTSPDTDIHPLMTANSSVQSMHQDPDSRIVTIDLSANFVTETNVGSDMEGAILQCIANTAGSAYNAQEVIITLDGQPYVSGHILYGAGETIEVDYDGAIDIS